MARPWLLLLFLGALMTLASATSAPTFCKCTCFKNSTIIPLGPASQTESSNTEPASSPSLLRRSLANIRHLQLASRIPTIREDLLNFSPTDSHIATKRNNSPRSASTSCSSCTKAFCLSQGIKFCKDAEEDDVTTMCFQRDSNKDKIIVWAFIVGTVGLLGWAMFKRVMEWREVRHNVSYASMGARGR